MGGLALQGFCTLLSSISGVSLLGGPYRFTRVLLMSLDSISACSWLLHDNKSGRSYRLGFRVYKEWKNGNYCNGSYRDYCKDPFLHS